MIEVLKTAAFRNLWLAGLLSVLGREVSRIGIFLYLLHEHGSVASLALFVACKTLAGVLAAPAAGLVVDRFSKRRVMIGTDIVRAGFMMVILIHPSLVVIYVMGALQSVATALFEPAKSASIALILDPEQLPKGNGVEHSTRNLVMILGPVLGAELVIQGGLAAILIFDATSYLLSAWLVLRVKIPVLRPSEKARAPALAEIREGWSYFFEHRLVRHLALLFFVSMLTAGIWVPLAPFFIRDFLGASERVLGVQLAFFGAGGMAGGFLAAWLSSRVRKGAILFAALLAEGVHLAVYALVSNVLASCIVLFFWGITVSMILVSSRSILQTEVEERFLGRVFSVVNQGENLAMMSSMGLAALLGGILSSQEIFLGAGLLYVAVVLASASTRGGRTLLGAR